MNLSPDKEDGGWVIKVKELPGCITQADEWDDVLPMIEEAKQLWLEVALEYGHTIPEPQGIPGESVENSSSRSAVRFSAFY